MDYKIILRNGIYALLDTNTQYIVACNFDETQPKNQQWGHGIYFEYWDTDEETKQNIFCNALETFRGKTEMNYIPRCRLEELATKFKDGLIEDDKESAMEYFDYECEMTDEEKDFFGLNISE